MWMDDNSPVTAATNAMQNICCNLRDMQKDWTNTWGRSRKFYF